MSETITKLEPSTDPESLSWMSVSPRRELDVKQDTLPDWYREFQNRSWRDFLETGNPGRKDQDWRFANLKVSRFEGLVPAWTIADADAALVDDLKARSVGSAESAGRFIFHNQRLILSQTDGLADGVIAMPIAQALVEHGELVRKHFMRDETRLGGKKFAALHGAADLSGVFIYVPKNVRIEEPIEIFHSASGSGSVIFPHTLIVSEENAEVNVVDYFQSSNDTDDTVAIGVSDLVVGDGSKVQYTAMQEWNTSSRHFQQNSTRVGRDSNASRCIINLGARWARDESASRLMAPGGNSDMLAVNLATGDEEYDLRTLQLHEAEHTTSDLLYKNALYDQARTIFSGMIVVGESAHHTDAFQTCNNLIGSEEAEANSMPGLEISADEVKCSHGSTAGQISDEEVFYLRTRGIDPEQARRMITYGFLNAVLGKISCEALREHLAGKLRHKFDSLT